MGIIPVLMFAVKCFHVMSRLFLTFGKAYNIAFFADSGYTIGDRKHQMSELVLCLMAKILALFLMINY